MAEPKTKVTKRKVVVQEFITLDGVMQAPGTKDEDTRNNFVHGGWQLPFYDDKVVQFMIERYRAADALLLGARTYRTFADYWPTAPDDGNPFVAEMNRLKKYVVSNSRLELDWTNSEQITGDTTARIKELKNEGGMDMLVLGSGNFVQSLIANDLVDEYVLMMAPLKLGTGTRLFNDDTVEQKLTLQNCTPASTGELLLTYTVNRGVSIKL
jgi:dihydrofolate reductase